MKELRIAFAGAPGTGKTTLAEQVSLELKVPMFPSPYNRAQWVPGERRFLVPILQPESSRRHQLELESCNESFVVDVSALDNLALKILHYDGAIEQHEWDECVSATERYTHIIYCPTSAFVCLKDDVEPLTYKMAYDAVIRGLLVNTHTPFLLLHQSSFEKRREATLRFLSHPSSRSAAYTKVLRA